MKNILSILLIILLGVSAIGADAFPIESQRTVTDPQLPMVFDFEKEVAIEINISSVAYGHELLWKANTTGTNYEESAVTYTDGIAYIGSCSTHGAGHDKIFAVDTTTGDIIWSNDTGPGYVGPVIDGDVVYIGSSTHGYDPENEYMYAFDRFTGEQVWKTPIYGGIAESVQYDETKIYFCSGFYETKMYALNKNDGSINWTYETGFSVCANKPMLKDNAVYGAFWDNVGKLFKINATTGQEIWSISLSAGPWDNSITADGLGRIFLAIYYSSTMNAYSEQNGQLLWTYSLHGGPLSFNAYHNGHVFIADTLGYVYALNASTGHLLWETKIGGCCDISSPTLSGGLLFIGTRDGPDGAFYALNETTGSVLWRYQIGASITAPPSIVDGMMLCGSDGWNMYAFDVGTGGGDWLLHRYDRWNTAYSPVGLETWQYVRAACSSQQDIITCVVTNVYDHQVQNIVLHLPFSASWYTESGELLKENSDTYTLDSLPTGGAQTLLISQEPLFTVTITKPENALYVANTKILPFFVPILVGSIEVQASVHEVNKSLVDRVEFYIDDELQEIDTMAPYGWLWSQRSFGAHMIKVIAYKNDKSTTDELKVWKIF
ncbi:MAG TPA: PQQ-binding-like beta-propeller repeat protein [Candidatus Thermoplasmatota archaeon]|nr:PQQ-binding-like beta-propeller repeat protein [Candidatus Thermoplasmatota archaeon]